MIFLWFYCTRGLAKKMQIVFLWVSILNLTFYAASTQITPEDVSSRHLNYDRNVPAGQRVDGKNSSVYVCITGQLARLELRNKIERLFKPLIERNFRLFIGLALTTEESPQFTNDDNGDRMQLYSGIPQVWRALTKVKGIEKVRHFSKVNRGPTVKSPKININYQKSLLIKPTVNNSMEARNNAKQIAMLQYCNYWPKILNEVSFFIRLREDTFVDRLNLDPVIRLAQGGAVVTTACDAWRGINDKIAFGPSSRASDFFYSSTTILLGN